MNLQKTNPLPPNTTTQTAHDDSIYRSLFEKMDQGFCILEMIFDGSGKPIDYLFLEVNPVFEAQTGLKDAPGKTALQLVPGLEEHWFQIYGRVAVTGESTQFIQGSEQMGRWFEVFAYKVGAPSGSKVALVFTDITQTRQVEIALRESEERFRLLAETLPQLVWMTDKDGRQEYVSKRWKEYTGIEPTGADSWQQMIHAEDLNRVGIEWSRCLKTGDHYGVELRIKTADGVYRWAFGSAEPIRDQEGKILKWVGAFTDIHDQKTITENLENLVTERTKELRRSNEDLQQFAHVASHDLKEPVRKIMYFTNQLKTEMAGNMSSTADTFLAKIESSATRMYSMIDGVLLYSSLDAVEQPGDLIDFNELLKTIEDDLERSIANHNAQIKYSSLPALKGSSILLYQLFYNLISNALKFFRPNTRLLIEVTAAGATALEVHDSGLPPGNYTRISVKDNGIGFSTPEKEKIFGIFTRLHSRDQYEGTGLGLSLCRKIVERHKGAIYAEGEEGTGAEFVILLPAD